jgi:hypothetical protein
MKYIFCILGTIIALTSFAQKVKPSVVNIYPTSDSIPVNILRFYIEFSHPIQELGILNHIKLTTEDGRNITDVFFENQYELWNDDRTKVTLIVDPGRVKTGLLAHNILGRAFDNGNAYYLTVDSLLRDFNDENLNREFSKKFNTVSEDTTAPNLSDWSVTCPNANTVDFLKIDFNDRIDHISAKTLIKVADDNGRLVEGKIILEKNESVWIFKPVNKWKKGTYNLIVNSRLEDIAANSLNEIFDHKKESLKMGREQYSERLKFDIR